MMRFSIGLGDPPQAVPVDGVGVSRATYLPELGFVFNTDAEFGSKFETASAWHAAGRMATEIEEQLCRKVSGKPCPV
jgi:hypothetical protein